MKYFKPEKCPGTKPSASFRRKWREKLRQKAADKVNERFGNIPESSEEEKKKFWEEKRRQEIEYATWYVKWESLDEDKKQFIEDCADMFIEDIRKIDRKYWWVNLPSNLWIDLKYKFLYWFYKIDKKKHGFISDEDYRKKLIALLTKQRFKTLK